MSNQVFKNSNITIEGNTIRWEKQMIRADAIVRMWQGNCTCSKFPVKFAILLLFIALSGSIRQIIIRLLALLLLLAVWEYQHRKQMRYKGIHLESSSGQIYSLISDNEPFTEQAYGRILELFAEGTPFPKLEIDFSGDGKIIEHSEEAKENQAMNILSKGINGQIIKELQSLLNDYRKKKETNAEILNLLENTIQAAAKDNKEELKKSFGKFVTMGLIEDCNQLGLNTLISEIKAYIY